MSHSINLEFIKQPLWHWSRCSWLGLILLVLSMMIAFFVFNTYQHKQTSIALLNEQLAQLEQQNSKKKVKPALESSPVSVNTNEQINPEQIKQTKQIISELAIPWQRLFYEIEQSRQSDVALLSVSPEIKKANITLTGEAKDLASALAYVQMLESKDMFSQVYLQKHSIDELIVGQPLAFVIVAHLHVLIEGAQ